MSKHTPGPWHYLKIDEWSHRIATNHGQLPDGSPNYWTVADINKRREPEHEANAKLISAAPELLAALSRLIGAYSSSHSPKTRDSCWALAHAAIAKATGEKE